MSEWGVVGVLSALAGLFFVVYTPLARRAQERSDERYELERQRTSSTKENTEAVTRLTTTIELMA
ncbi:MAG: hypothetical protein RR244_04970, partial [Oscillospiraceae bacterium]